MYWSALIFILGCVVYAYYSYCQIKLSTKGWNWHLAQWAPCVLFLGAGFLFGRQDLNWHNFGRIVGIAVIGIPVYVFFLHFLLGNHK